MPMRFDKSEENGEIRPSELPNHRFINTWRVKLIDEIGDGADRRKKRIRAVERFVRRSGDHGVSTEDLKAISDYSLGLTGKKVGEIIKLLKKLGKIHLNEKRRWVSL